jgi:hypothetical protein
VGGVVPEEVGFGEEGRGRVIDGCRFDDLAVIAHGCRFSSHVMLCEGKGMRIYFLQWSKEILI